MIIIKHKAKIICKTIIERQNLLNKLNKQSYMNGGEKMKSKILASVLAILMIFSSSIIFAEGNDEVSQGKGEMYGDKLQTQEQTQNRYMKPTCNEEEETKKKRNKKKNKK